MATQNRASFVYSFVPPEMCKWLYPLKVAFVLYLFRSKWQQSGIYTFEWKLPLNWTQIEKFRACISLSPSRGKRASDNIMSHQHYAWCRYTDYRDSQKCRIPHTNPQYYSKFIFCHMEAEHSGTRYRKRSPCLCIWRRQRGEPFQ